MDLHYPYLPSGAHLRWLPWRSRWCCCGRRRCPVLVVQERARFDAARAAHWDTEAW